jgi:hypothetical protein
VSLQEIHNTSAPDSATARNVPLAAGAEAATTQSQPITANSNQPPPTGSGGKVTRQMSPNLPAPVVAAPAFQSVSDFVAAYDQKKKTIDDLTDKFVEKAGEAKRAQDDIIPHLASMQSLLSKKGTNHHLVIAARKQETQDSVVDGILRVLQGQVVGIAPHDGAPDRGISQ